MEDNKKAIVKKIQDLSGRRSPYQIFSDWLEMCAIAIQNSCVLDHDEVWEKREQRYKDVAKQYNSEEQNVFAEILALLTDEFELEIEEKQLTDVLGEIYMELNYGNKNLGQVFTPYSLSQLCAEIVVDENEEEVSFLEPSCGGGSMVIAVAQKLLELNKNYQRMMRGVCQDLDDKCVRMCYVQLSLLCIDAIVVQGDSLTDPYRKGYPKERVWRTPRNTGLIF